MPNDSPPLPHVLLWGGRSKARIIEEMLREGGVGKATLIFDATLEKPAFETGCFFTNDIRVLRDHLPRVSHYVACIGGDHGYARYMTSRYLEKVGLLPISIVHPKSFIEPTATVGKGCQFMPLSVLHKFTQIGDQCLLNTHCTVDHECILGNGVHVMGNAAIAGKVTIGDFATVGTNATILPYLTIGEGAFVGAGAVVTRNVEPYSVVAGVPAVEIRKNHLQFDEELAKLLVSS